MEMIHKNSEVFFNASMKRGIDFTMTGGHELENQKYYLGKFFFWVNIAV